MKKLLTLMLVSALVFAVTAPAMAMHFEMNGQSRVRHFYLGNYDPAGGFDDPSEFIDQRFRVTLRWGLSDNVFLKARADILEGFWGSQLGTAGEDPGQGLFTDGSGSTVAPEFGGSSTKAQIAFDHIYGQFTLPSAPITAIIGRQDASWASGVLVKSDVKDRVKLIYAMAPVKLILGYDKNNENFQQTFVDSSRGDDWDVLGAIVFDGGTWKTGFLGVYAEDKGGIVKGTANVARDTTKLLGSLYFNGAFGPLNVKSEFVATSVDKDETSTTTTVNAAGVPVTTAVRSTGKTEGIGGYVGLFFNAGMVNFGLEGAYADDFSFDYHSAYNSILFFGALEYDGYGGLTSKSGDTGVSNATSIKASAAAKPMEKLTLKADALWAQSNDEDKAGLPDSALGFEVDLFLIYNIYDNLAYTLGLGYAFLGDAFPDRDDPLGMMNRIEVKF